MTDGPMLALFSVHQRDAPIDARERFVRALPPVAGSDVLALTTCHRVEIAIALTPTVDIRGAIADRLRTELPLEGAIRVGRDAVLHLMRVGCGLDSVVRGEGQILGQLRGAFDAGRANGGLEPSLALLARRAIELGRELRRTTALGTVRRSLGSLAVDTALDGLADPARAAVLVIGAGEVGKLALRALASRVGTILVANRDLARAAELASVHGATAVPLEMIDDALARVAAVIAAADTRGTVLTASRLRARLARGPLTIVDLAVPRSVAPDARDLEGLRYVDVDGLSDVAGAQLEPAAVAEIEAQCADAADAVMHELDVRRAVPTIRALHERADATRRKHLDRALSRLAHLSARDRQVVESLSEGLTHALLHEPTIRLRQAPERERAVRDLFAL